MASRLRPAPERHELTVAEHPRSTFKRAIARGNLAVAGITARCGVVGGSARARRPHRLKGLRRHGARWVRRLLDENPTAGLDDLALAVGCLSVKQGDSSGRAGLGWLAGFFVVFLTIGFVGFRRRDVI